MGECKNESLDMLAKGWQIALPDWRRGADKTVIKHRQEHHEYLVTKGVLDQ